MPPRYPISIHDDKLPDTFTIWDAHHILNIAISKRGEYSMPRPGTRIIDYTDAELKEAIEETKREIGDDAFYTILKGIDAYFEQRRRKFPVEYGNSSPHRPGGK